MPFEVKVNRIYEIADKSRKLKAFADIEINNSLLIKGFMIVNGKNGMFVSTPREKGKDTKWHETVRALTPEAKNKISSVILSVYNNKQ